MQYVTCKLVNLIEVLRELLKNKLLFILADPATFNQLKL